jgi:hypothetical protein
MKHAQLLAEQYQKRYGFDKEFKDSTCTWCRKEVNEQDFKTHAVGHYQEQKDNWVKNARTTVTSISTVSYVKELG